MHHTGSSSFHSDSHGSTTRPRIDAKSEGATLDHHPARPKGKVDDPLQELGKTIDSISTEIKEHFDNFSAEMAKRLNRLLYLIWFPLFVST
jgi:hypothetical protein